MPTISVFYGIHHEIPKRITRNVGNRKLRQIERTWIICITSLLTLNF